MLIILPGHLQVSGVTTWAMRAINGLHANSIPAGLIVHTSSGESVPPFLEPYVVAVVKDAPDMDQLEGALDKLIPVYRSAIESMYNLTNQPVIVAPNLHGDCTGAIAAIAQGTPNLIRTVSWVHSDNGYDIAVSRHFEQLIHAFVPVSSELAEIARTAIPSRADDINHIPHGVEIEPICPSRTTISNRPIRLVYTGRVEEHQKRISTLPHISRQLTQREIPHEFRVVGDGPAMDDLQDSCRTIDAMTLFGALPPHHVASHLRWADAWILPSRFEGQSVAMLEAMAQGCVPIVTQVRSGADDAVIHGRTGLSVLADWDTPLPAIANRMCDAIESFPTMDTLSLSEHAHRLVLGKHSTQTHAQSLIELIKRVRAMPSRAWPAGQRASYSARLGELSASTPSDAAQRMIHCLGMLYKNRVLIFGSGQHTKDLQAVIESSDAQIVGIIDDDPEKTGSMMMGCPVYTPDSIAELKATDLVISSWIHEEAIWSKRGVYESHGLRVHRLYHRDIGANIP